MYGCLSAGTKKRGSCKEVGIGRGSTVEFALYVYLPYLFDYKPSDFYTN